ncbi:MAG: hypothetical protein ACI82H_002216, partial [Alphaproteobacteria bacterium]
MMTDQPMTCMTWRSRALATAAAMGALALLTTAPASAAEDWKTKWDKVV